MSHLDHLIDTSRRRAALYSSLSSRCWRHSQWGFATAAVALTGNAINLAWPGSWVAIIVVGGALVSLVALITSCVISEFRHRRALRELEGEGA